MMSLLLALVLAGQEADWIEIRFHRVHLRNGNFIDGALVSQTEQEVVLKMKVGNMAIRSDMIDFVESMKIRSLHEKPPVLAKPALLAPSVRARSDNGRILPFPEGAGATAAKVLPLLDRYRQTAPENRYAVMNEILTLGADIGAVLTCLLESADAEVRSVLVEALTILKDRQNLASFVKLLGTDDADLRAQVTGLIGALGKSGANDAVRRLLKDPSPAVRASAATALQLMDDEKALGEMVPLCADTDPWVRGRAINATLELARGHDRMPETARELSRLIDRMNGPEKPDVVMALAKTGVPESVPALLSLLSDGDPKVRAQAVPGLGLAQDRDSGEVLLARLQQERETPVRLELLKVIGKRKLLGAIDTVLPWIAESDEDLKKGAAKTLRTLTGQSFGPDYERWSEWWSRAKPRN